GEDFLEHPELARTCIGWLPERAPLWPELTVTEHLDAHARIRGLNGAALRAAGTAVILSTHVLAEVTAVCDRVAILHEGALQHEGTVEAGDHAALERRF